MKPLRILITKWNEYMNYCDTFLAAITAFWKGSVSSRRSFRQIIPIVQLAETLLIG
jgi:hypothetical protein